MDTGEAHDYVRSALAIAGVALDETSLDRVVAEFERFAQIAAGLLASELPRDSEPAPVFRP